MLQWLEGQLLLALTLHYALLSQPQLQLASLKVVVSASLKVVVSAAVPLFAAGHVAMIVEKMPLLHLVQAIMPQGPRAGNFNQFSLQLRTWVELKILCSYQRLHRVSKEKHVLSVTLA